MSIENMLAFFITFLKLNCRKKKQSNLLIFYYIWHKINKYNTKVSTYY